MRLFLIVVIITGAIGGASAQTTADGVAAMARGDYQRAVEILKPIAENFSTSDPAAQIFMAGLYETGRGVPADPLRACALYQRATSQFEHPLGRLAMALFSSSISRGGRKFDQQCQTLANIGFDTGFEPATFHLGPGHSVEWTLGEATVTHQGRTRDHPGVFAERGARFLPLQHTELDTGPTRSLKRHFIQMFVWQQIGGSGPWRLRWDISEVIRDEIIRIDTPESVVTVTGDAPPSPETFDVREYAVLRVDDEGHPEWAVLKGDRPETQRIESDAERREVREEALARETALKGVDWSRRSDAERLPAMTYSAADGCGFLQVYGWTGDRTEAIVIQATDLQVDRPTLSAIFDLARERANISVEAYVYDAPQRHFEFCSDVRMVGPDSREPGKWPAVAGTIVIELSPPGVRARSPHLRRATITLTNVVLRSPDGKTVRMPGPVKLTAIVGSVLY